MTIDAMQRKTNVESSVAQYILDTIVAVDGVKVELPMVDFDASKLASWLKVTYLSFVTINSYRNGNANGEAAHDWLLLLQLTPFVRKNSSTGVPVSPWVLSNLRDTVAARFPAKKEITVKDYFNAGTTSVGVLTVRRLGTDSAVILENATNSKAGMESHALTVEIIYTALDGSA